MVICEASSKIVGKMSVHLSRKRNTNIRKYYVIMLPQKLQKYNFVMYGTVKVEYANDHVKK